MNPGTPISFDGNNLQTTNILTKDIDHLGIPTKLVKLYNYAHGHASDIPYADYSDRTVKIAGELNAASAVALEALADTFKSYFIGTKKNLDIGYNGSTRRYIATVQAMPIPRPGGYFFADFNVDFICTDPFGRDITTTDAIATVAGRTLASYSDSHTFAGTAPVQMPVTTITYASLTASAAAYVMWGNGATGQMLVINRVWTAGDVLVIDADNKNVTVNGLPVYFTGSWPEFPGVSAGAQTLQYYDTFSARSFTIHSLYTARWL